MSQKDQLKWDKKYTDNPRLLESREASVIVQRFSKLASGKKALDIACGTGRNTLYLAQNGFEIDALDISAVALQELSQHMNKVTDLSFIHTQLVDLDQYSPPLSHYNLIINIHFLDRSLISKLGKALKKDGILIVETYMQDDENEKPNSNPDFLLKKDELPSYFNDDYEILGYEEFWNDNNELYRMRKQAIVVKRV
ncbi:MAG TPA: methyltransferase domain-containing protein [Sulfurovum sp.]|nr:methyltransferase domain-containing protein [Sulfurovum sp.]